jgi:hypothetical protein
MRKLMVALALTGVLSISQYCQAQGLPYGGNVPALARAYCPATLSLPKTASFSQTSLSGSLQIVAAVSGTKIQVLGWDINTLAATNLKFVEGTGTNCATGATNTTGIFNAGGANTAVTSPLYLLSTPIYTTTASDALCINSGSSTTVSGFLTYCQE